MKQESISEVLETVARKWVQKTVGCEKTSEASMRALHESFEETGVSLSLEEVREAMQLREARSVPNFTAGGENVTTIGGFLDFFEDALESAMEREQPEFKGQAKSTRAVIGVSADLDSDEEAKSWFEQRTKSIIRNAFEGVEDNGKKVDVEASLDSVEIQPPGRYPTWYGEEGSDLQTSKSQFNPSSQFFSIYFKIVGEGFASSGFRFKLSGSSVGGSSGGMNAADFEIGIAIAYEILNDGTDPSLPYRTNEGTWNPLADVEWEEIQGYAQSVGAGSLEEKALAATPFGIAFLLRAQNTASDYVNFGGTTASWSGSDSTDPAPYGRFSFSDGTPKTDLKLGSDARVSLKQTGGSQYGSPQPESAAALLAASVDHFLHLGSNKETVKDAAIDALTEARDALVGDGDVQGSLNRIARQSYGGGSQMKANITGIREVFRCAYYSSQRAKDLADAVKGASDFFAGQGNCSSARSDWRIKPENQKVADHLDKELRQAGITSKWSGEEIRAEDLQDPSDKSGVARLYSSNEVVQVLRPSLPDIGDAIGTEVHEMYDAVLSRMEQHRSLSEKMERIFSGDNPAMSEAVLFESVTGLAKFNGNVYRNKGEKSPYKALENASDPTANYYVVFEPVVGGAGSSMVEQFMPGEKFKKVKPALIQEMASTARIRVSFKTRSSNFNTSLRLESTNRGSDLPPYLDVFRQSCLTEKRLIEARIQSEFSHLLNESWLTSAGDFVKKIAKKTYDLFEYAKERFFEFVNRAFDSAKRLILKAVDLGAEALFRVLGFDPVSVKIS